MIAKVEPLTTARALRGPFDYKLGDRFARRRGREPAARAVRAPAAARGRGRAWRRRRSCRRSAWPSRSPPLAARCPEAWSTSGLWVAREYCSTRLARPGAGAAARSGGKGVGARTELRAALTHAGREALAGSERLGPKQRAALERLAAADGPVAAGDDRDSLKRLEARGLVELSARQRSRAGRSRSRSGPAASARSSLRAGCARANHGGAGRSGRRAPPSRRDGLGQDRGLPDGDGGGARARSRRDRPGARDRADAADGVALRGTLWRPRGGSSLGAERGRAPRRVAARCAAARRGSASGRARPCSRRWRGSGSIVVDEEHDSSYKQESDPRYDARDVARAPRARGAGDAGRGHRHAAPRELGAPGADRALRARRRLADAGDRGPRHARARRARGTASTPRTREALTRARRGRREGDRDGAAARLVAVPRLPGVRARVVLPELRRLAGPPPRGRHACAAITAATPSGCRRAARSARPSRSRATAPARSGSRRSSRSSSRRSRSCGSTRTRRRGRARTRRSSAEFDRAESAVLIGTQMVAKGHDFPDVGLSVSSTRTRAFAFPTSGPRSGPSRWSPSSRGAAGGEARGRVLVQTLAPEAEAIRRAADARRGRLSRGRARAAPGALLSAVRDARAGRDGREGGAGGRERGAPDRCPPASAPASRRDRCSGPAPRFRLRDRERRQVLVKARGPRGDRGRGARGRRRRDRVEGDAQRPALGGRRPAVGRARCYLHSARHERARGHRAGRAGRGPGRGRRGTRRADRGGASPPRRGARPRWSSTATRSCARRLPRSASSARLSARRPTT